MNNNKIIKKILTGILGTAMLAAMPVYAAGVDNEMRVDYLYDTSYQLRIPATIELSSDEETTVDNIGVSEVNVVPGKTVQVKIQSGITNNQVVLTRKDDIEETKVVSDVTDYLGNKVSNGTVVAEFQGMSTEPITENTGILIFSAVKDSEGGTVKAGNYQGIIYFGVDVVGQ